MLMVVFGMVAINIAVFQKLMKNTESRKFTKIKNMTIKSQRNFAEIIGRLFAFANMN